MLVQMQQAVEKIYPDKIKTLDIFIYPTISKLSNFIEGDKHIQEVKVAKIKFPKDYFIQDNSYNENVELKVGVEDAIYNKLLEIACKQQIQLIDILLSVFMFMLSDATETNKINIQYIMNNGELMYPCTADLSGVEDLNELFKLLKEERSLNQEKAYNIKNLENRILTKEYDEIIPVFCYYNTLRGTQRKEIDVIFEINEGVNKMEISCDYNSQRIKKSKMVELLNGYINLLKIITDNSERMMENE